MDKELSQQLLEKDKLYYEKYQTNFVKKFNKTLQYGTAGFRNKAEFLELVSLRVGVFSAIVGKLHERKANGCCITASHNPIADNGYKQIDFDGGVLRRDLEVEVGKFVNTESLVDAIATLKEYLLKTYPNEYKETNVPLIFTGIDTRPSGVHLLEIMEFGMKEMGAVVKSLGYVSTPMNHFAVKFYNDFPH